MRAAAGAVFGFGILLTGLSASAGEVVRSTAVENSRSEWVVRLEKALEDNERVEGMVEYRPDALAREREAKASSASESAAASIKVDIARSSIALISFLRAQRIEIIKIYDYQPLIRVRLSAKQAQLLAEQPDVVNVHLENFFQRESNSSTEQASERLQREELIDDDAARMTDSEYVNADDAWAKGFEGKGYAVAVLDDGINAQHEMFKGGKLLAEACFSNPNGNGDSLCPNGATIATGTGSASSKCSAYVLDDVCGHGSHVAGIAIGNNRASFLPEKGVAPEGNLVAIQVFHRRIGTANCTGGQASCTRASSFDLVSALDWVIANAAQYKIAAVNMSLGSGSYTAYCDSQSTLTSGINTLRKMGVLTAIAAGNDGDLGVVSHPACIRKAIAVSSVIITAADSGVNHGPLVDILAPGYLVRSAAGITSSSYTYKTGTSMATPVVAGAIVLLKAAKPEMTADQIEYAMTSTGPLVSSVGWTWKTPRLDVNAALNVLGVTPPPQGVALVGLLSKKNSDAGSFVRFMNIGTSSGTANINLLLDEPKTTLGTYTVKVPANASVQVLVADIESALNFAGSTSTLSAYIDADFKGFTQHIVVSWATQALTNLTTCSSVSVDPKTFLGNVHTPKVGSGYPSQVLVHNSGTSAVKAVFDVYDSPSGSKIGTFETQNVVPPNASTVFSALSALDAIGLKPEQDNYLVNFKLQSSFTGFTEHIIKNVNAGVITDMSVKCPL